MRRSGRLAGAPERLERAGDRDVVDVVAGHRRVRAVLAVAGEPAVDEARVAREARRRDRCRGARRLRAGTPRSSRRRASASRRNVVDAVGRLQVEPDRALATVHRVRRAGATWSAARATSARSTRSTSAPRSASSIPQNGPGPSPVISTTRSPASGPRHGAVSRSTRRTGGRARVGARRIDHEDALGLGERARRRRWRGRRRASCARRRSSIQPSNRISRYSGIDRRYRTVSVPVRPGAWPSTRAAPSTMSNAAATIPPCTHPVGPRRRGCRWRSRTATVAVVARSGAAARTGATGPRNGWLSQTWDRRSGAAVEAAGALVAAAGAGAARGRRRGARGRRRPSSRVGGVGRLTGEARRPRGGRRRPPGGSRRPRRAARRRRGGCAPARPTG